MKLTIDCPVLSVVSKTPEFQALKERFTYTKHGNDHLLLNLLVQYREDNNLGKEWYPESEEQMQKFGHFVEENTTVMNPKGKTSEELVNLYNTMYTQFTPEQLKERISYIAYDFWNVVNKLEDNDTQERSRLQLIESYTYNGQKGYKAILEYIFEQYDNWATEQFNVDNIARSFKARGTELSDSLMAQIRKLAHDKAEKYKVIVDNKAMLSALALNKIGETEGLEIKSNGLEVNFSEMSEADLEDGATDVNEDEDGNDDNDGTKGDRYYDYRTAKLMNTLSVQCRRILFGIPQLNSQGKTVNNDLIRPKLLDLRRTVVTLKRIALTSTPDTFLDDINAASVEMPWLKGVYNKLSDNPSYAATVYSSVKGTETTYCATILENGRYKTIVVNSKARGKALMAEAGRNISGGLIAYDDNYSITDENGDIVSAEKLQKVYDNITTLEEAIKDFTETITILDDYEYNEDTDNYAKENRYPKVVSKLVDKYGGKSSDYEYLKQGGSKAMEAFLKKNATLIAELASHLRGIGFDVMASDIRTAALESMGTFENAKKFWGVKNKASNANKLSGLVSEVRAFVKSVQDFKRQNPNGTGSELYAQRTDEYSDINKYLALSRIGDLEDRVVNEGKSLQTINNVSLLHQRLDKIAKMSEQEIREKVLPYEGMGLGFGDELRATGWLTGAYKGIKVFDGVSFNHKEYGKMSPQQKMTNALLNYFMPPSWNSNHLYEVCIQSDYDTAYNFVSAPSYTKDELVKLMSDEVLIELERIASIQERIENDKDRIKYDVRDKQGQKIFIFPELNSNGFISEYNQAKTIGPDEAERVLRRHVSEQLDKLAARDAAYYDSKGIFRNKYLKFVPTSKSDHTGLNFYSENGTFEDLDQKAKDAFLLMAMNYYYARQQITKLTAGDLAHFNGLADFEKRNMMFHTPHTSMYAREDMVYKNKPAGISKQKVVYIEDDVVASKYVEEAKKCLKALYDKKVITKSQFDNMSKAYDKIKVTDGQGFRTLDSRRRLDIAAGNWSDKLEDAYWRIMAGKPNSSDIEIFFNPKKPVYTGYDVIPAAVGQHQKPVQVPVFHKYSEVILLPESLSGSSIQAQSSPMRALSKVASEKGIDLMMFSSNVKVGGFSVVTPFAKDKDGNRILTNENEFAEYMSSEIDRNPSSIHILDLEGYGIAASISAHGEDDKISFSTQAEKECFADIEAGELSGGNIEIDGKKATNDQLRTIYYQTKAADIMEKYKKLQQLFGNPIELERILKEELQSKSYYSREMVFAIEQLKNGGTAFPLFAPNIRHNVEQLMASIITKRLTKPRYSGANLPEATAFGIDVESKPFTEEMLAEDEKLGIHFETDENGTKREYIDVYTTIYDSAFEEFADENGVITFERLWGKDGTGKTEGLVAEGKIPREALEFIAYRTPSDYVHSLFNCRVKGFIARTGGQVLYMPKDCMAQDGHDYDGDKKRCHFPAIKLDWDEDKMREAYSGNEKYASFEKFSAGLKSPRNIDRNKYRKITYEAYDFSKSASENSEIQRHNGRIQMLFSVLSSAAGTSRAMTPGEFEDTKVFGKAHYIIRNIDNSTSPVLKGIRDSHRDNKSLYDYLVGLDDKHITALMDELNANESPFSLTHAGQSYEYIMEPADMIGIYAMYGSTAMMLQRANLYYQPHYTKDGKEYEINIFGHKVDKLYGVRDRNGHYTSVTRSHLLNAAVDNGKDPVLGLLNQNPKLSAITNFLIAAGFSEEDIHLLMNQPIILELSKRAADVKEEYLNSLIQSIIDDMCLDNPAMSAYANGSEYIGLVNTANISADKFKDMLPLTFDNLFEVERIEERQQQAALLLTFKHILKAANQLTEFVRIVRPESESGTIGTSVSDAILKNATINKFRDDMEDEDFRIGGIQDIVRKRSLTDDMSASALPEVVALNTVMADNSFELFEPYFPEVKQTWVDTASNLLGNYNLGSKKQKSRRMSKIVYEMVLWKLLKSDSGFISSEIKDEQEKILKYVPGRVADLKKRINKAKKQIDKNETVTDVAAGRLVANTFLEHLTSDPRNPVATRRLQFGLNGPAIEGMKDEITAGWNALLMSDDAEIKQLAIDLFKYNVFSNGLEYGMYEFSHFAPFSVLVSTPGYITALQNMMRSDFADDAENFTRQYFMNHWNDDSFLYKIKLEDIQKNVSVKDGIITVTSVESDKPEVARKLEQLTEKPYVVIRSGENNKVMTLYKRSYDGTRIILTPVEKLGFKSARGQLTLQYNPQVAADDMKPIVSPKRQSLARSEDEVYGDSDYEMTDDDKIAAQRRFDVFANQVTQAFGAAAWGLTEQKAKMKDLEPKAEKADASNNDIENVPLEEPSSPEDIASQDNAVSDAMQRMMSGIFGGRGKMFSVAKLTPEERSIKESAIANGTFMKAPNGNPTNLTEKQWLQVRTKAFKDWFGDWENDPANASKVVDENGEPKVVYHGTAIEFSEFDFGKLGTVTGEGYFVDKLTGEKIEYDSSKAFFFTNDINAAYSYRNLSIYQIMKEKSIFYENLIAAINKNNYLFTKLEGAQKERQSEFIDNIISPIIGYDVRNAINKDLLNEEQKQELLKFINDKLSIIDHNLKFNDARAISNQRNNYDDWNNLLNLIKTHRDDILNGVEIDYFSHHDMTIAINDNWNSIHYSKSNGRYEIVYKGSNGLVPVNSSNIEQFISECQNSLDKLKDEIARRESEGGYDAGSVMSVFLNIKNPMSHDYENSAFPDRYKNTKYPTSYIAARQVRKAIKDGNDGVIYNNVRDPFEMSSYGIFNPNQIKSATDNNGEFSKSNNNIYLSIARTNEEGKAVIEKVPATPENIREARKQKVYVSLNKKLREILREKGVAVGVLDDAEALLGVNGITDFETAPVFAEGLLEMIRIAEGYEGEQALPEEFAHIALEMLGHDNHLVKRLLDVLSSNEEALREAYGDEYDEYARLYGEDHDKLALEAAGKLVAKQLFRQEEIETAPVRSLIQRICDAIKNFFRKFRRDEVQNAIFEANDIASKVAKGMFGGELIDLMSLDNVHQSGQFAKIKTDLTGKHDVLSKLLKIEAKRLSILKKRLGAGADLTNEPSVVATQTQITKLESAIENYKTEDAIVTYMTNSLDFLAKTEESLDNSINAGRKANDVCKKLNTVRDTLYSFSQAIDAVNDAIVDGNVEDNQALSESIAKVQEVISRFFIKYERYAKKYFEEMLSNVYGDSGVTVNIGRDRGRTITIKEMARKADSDIGFMSRWFNSIADCNDYVLMAVDDTTRKAKMRARRRFNDVRPRIEKVVANLMRETGSSDTTFMFEMKRYDGGKWCNKAKDDGKLHKTGYYISKDSIAYKNLSKAQKEFYDTFMEIKKMADDCIPESLVEDNKMIMLRKYTLQKVKDAEGIGGKILTGWEGIRNAVMETSDEYDPEYEEVAVDFENNKVDRLPIKYLSKGSKEQYDDMTDDVASSLVAYAGMAFEFDEVNGVINILENAKYMASERTITQKTGSKTKRETINTDPDKKDEGIMFREPFSQKAMSSNAQAALEDFFQMHLYGHIHKAEGTFGNTRISKRKVVDALNNVTSLTQMAVNLPQRFANVNTGMSQILIESIGKGHFKPKDLSWAIAMYTKETGDRLVDLGKTDYDNKLSLFADKFDLHQDNGRRQTGYAKKRISRILNSSLLYAGLTAGEDFLALTTSLAIAHTYKVKSPDGKTECLYDAYEVRYSGPNKTGAYLALKDGYTKFDGSPIDKSELKETFEEQYEKECAAMNFEMQGIYNLDDRSAIQQYAAGSLLIMYRKWIAPSLRRRYGKTKYNALKGEFEEGYYTTVFKFLRDCVIDSKNSLTEEQSANALLSIYNTIKGIKNSMSVNWDKMTEYEKSNMKRAEAEMSIVIGLYITCALSGKVPPRRKEDDPDYKPTWYDRQVMSQIFRLRSELGSQAPTPMMVNEALHIMRSPFAAMGPITSTLNGLKLLVPSTYFTEIKSGRYKGHSKAYKYFRELPIIAAYKKIENFIDPTPLINYYKNEIVY